MSKSQLSLSCGHSAYALHTVFALSGGSQHPLKALLRECQPVLVSIPPELFSQATVKVSPPTPTKCKLRRAVPSLSITAKSCLPCQTISPLGQDLCYHLGA